MTRSHVLRSGRWVLAAAVGLAGVAAQTGPASATATTIEEIRIEVGEFTFDAIVAGPEDGEAVFLLHGFPETYDSYRAQVESLAAAGYRAIAPNQRGYSPDARPNDVASYAIVNLVNDVGGMANALGIERFHLVGHDWGGAVAWVFAALFPDRLSSLTVLSTPHPEAFLAAVNDPGSEQAERSSYFNTFQAAGAEDALLANDAAVFRDSFASSGMTDEQIERSLATLGTPEALGAALNWYRALDAAASASVTLPRIATPTMYLYSTGDSAFTRSTADASAAYVDGPFRYEVLDGVSHWILEEVPDTVTDLLLEHLAT